MSAAEVANGSRVRIGVSFPTTEIGDRPDDVRHFAETVESIGYDHITCIDHVIQGRDAGALGLDTTVMTEGRGPNALREEFEAWCALGATHVTLRTMTAGYREVGQHVDALAAAYEAVTAGG